MLRNLEWSKHLLPNGHDTGHPDQLATPVHRLINAQFATETTLPEINEAVENHLRNAKKRDPSQQTDNEFVAPRMDGKPPSPVERDVLARTFLDRHLVSLQGEVSQKVTKDQEDQKIDRLLYWHQSRLHAAITR